MTNEGRHMVLFCADFLVKTEILIAVLTGYMWLTSLVMNHQWGVDVVLGGATVLSPQGTTNQLQSGYTHKHAEFSKGGGKRSCTLQQIRCICHESHMSATKPHEYGKELACRDRLQNNHARVGDVTGASWWVSSQHTAWNCSWGIFEEASVWVKYLEPFQRLSYQQKTITVAK